MISIYLREKSMFLMKPNSSVSHPSSHLKNKGDVSTQDLELEFPYQKYSVPIIINLKD